MKKIKLILLLFPLLLCSCEVSKLQASQPQEGQVSVKLFGAKGDGVTDDTQAIQRAFDQSQAIYFPPGDYRIASANRQVHNPASLRILDKSAVRAIEFAPGARLYVSQEQQHDFTTWVILKIYTAGGDVGRLTIKGLAIFAEPRSDNHTFTGLKAIEDSGFHIEDLQIENAVFQNLTGAGILTYATKTTLKNIRTENTGSHGIGARNPYNLGETHALYIDGYESIDDRNYSIDFSGTQIGNDASTADPRDAWTGVVKNVRSLNSRRGIKTAGHWDLLLENVEIIRPQVYGFFINKSAPSRRITIKNMLIEASGDAAMSLNGQTNVAMTDVRIIGCADGMRLQNSLVTIDGLLIDGRGKSKSGLRIPSNASITNFTITGINDQYPVWILRGDVKLSNGKIYDNNGAYSLLVHENAGNVSLENLEFYDTRPQPTQTKGIMILKKTGTVAVKNIDDARLRSTKLENRTQVKITRF